MAENNEGAVDIPAEPPTRSDIINNLCDLFGNDPEHSFLGKIPKRRFTTISRDEIPLLISLALLGDTSNANPWKLIEDVYLDLLLSTNSGRARRDAIKVLLALNGISVPTNVEQQRPNWIGRHITQRGWKENQEQQMRLQGDIY